MINTSMVNTLFVTLIALVLAYTFSEIFRLVKIPRVVGQILAGIFIGIPFIKHVLITNEVSFIFSFIADIGIILMFFFVGLKINFGKFKKNVRESFYISAFNTMLPLVGGFLVGRLLFGLNNLTSLILGISVAVSSQAISLDILEEARLLKTKIGTLILTTGTVDDVFELLLISSLLIVFQSTLVNASFQKLFLDIAIFVLIIIILRLLLVPFALKIFEREGSRHSLFTGALIIVLFMAYIADILGISALIGALIAGILVRQSLLTEVDRKPWRMNEISHSIHILAFGFLIPIFFFNVGVNMDIYTIPSNLFLVFALFIVDIFGTLLGTIIGVLLSNGTFKEGMIVGWGIMPKGDTEIVIATLALDGGLIGVSIYTAIIFVAFITTIISPIIFQSLIKRYANVIRRY